MDSEWVDFKLIKSTVTMQMVLDHYGVAGLKRTGDELRGPCPLHGGGSASKQFCVNVSKNAFKCFAKTCNGRGNVLDFVSAKEHCNIRDAAVKLRDWFKVEESQFPSPDTDVKTPDNEPSIEPMVPRGVYRHFKGKEYLVVGVAVHSETREEFVVYRPLYDTYELTVRPKTMFTEDIEREGYCGPRFLLMQAIE